MDIHVPKQDIYSQMEAVAELSRNDLPFFLSGLIAHNRNDGVAVSDRDVDGFSQLLSELAPHESVVLAIQAAQWDSFFRLPLLTRLDCLHWVAAELSLWEMTGEPLASHREDAHATITHAKTLLSERLPFPSSPRNEWLGNARRIGEYTEFELNRCIRERIHPLSPSCEGSSSPFPRFDQPPAELTPYTLSLEMAEHYVFTILMQPRLPWSSSPDPLEMM